MKSKNNKQSWLRIFIPIVTILLLIIAVFVCFTFYFESIPDPASEKIIRELASRHLKKDPNDLTDKDFAKITRFQFLNEPVADIKLIRKFTNLEELMFNFMSPGSVIPKGTPKWKIFLARWGIIELPKQYSPPWAREVCTIDLRPIEKLTKLQRLDLYSLKIINANSIGHLTNLKELRIENTDIEDTGMLSQLKNLERLTLEENPIRDVKSIQALSNLEYLRIVKCDKIKIEQVEEIQKALPDTEIYFISSAYEQYLITKPSENKVE